MKIIAIEGIDKSGKHTATNYLFQKLISKGYKVEKGEFHDYSTPTGELIMKWLKKEWEVDQQTIELIMTADKQQSQVWFNKLKSNDYDFLILDRYLLSQAAYGIANGIDGRWIVELHRFMKYPDLDIVIDIPTKTSMSRKGKHNDGKNDKYESDFSMLEKVKSNYKNLSTSYSAPIRKFVNGSQKIEKVNEDVFQIVNEVFGDDK